MTDRDLFDLRGLLAQGIDPLPAVVERARSIAAGGDLWLDAPFNPLPLRRALAQLGFSSTAERVGDGHWRIFCHRDGQGLVAGGPTAEDCQGPPDPGAPVSWAEDGVHIDVRGMTAPRPLLAILRLCASVAAGEDIIVRHDRDPIYLYPELAEQGWLVETRTAAPGEVCLRLYREAKR